MTSQSFLKIVIFTTYCSVGAFLLAGCTSNAWMGDPTAQGYYKPTPTTIPILDRIDIIEEPLHWPKMSQVTSADLIPSDLTYKIAAGDALDVSIYGLYGQGQHFPVQRRVDQGGYFRVPEVGDVLVAGLTAQGAQDVITNEVEAKVMTHPSVQVDVLDQTGFTYTIYGGLSRWGVFTLRDPNLLLLEALSQAGGIPQSIKNIYVIRQLPVSDMVLPSWDRNRNNQDTLDKLPNPINSIPTTVTPSNNTSIEDLIKELDIGQRAPQKIEPIVVPEPVIVDQIIEEPTVIPDEAPVNEGTGVIPIEELIEELTPPTDPEPSVAPGIIQSGNLELVDVDDLVPPASERLPVDVDDLMAPSNVQPEPTATYIYVSESDSWVQVSTDQKHRINKKEQSGVYVPAPSMLERIIVIPWERLRKGDSSLNIVIRPEDRIYVEPPPLGNLFIRGEVARPGIFDYPITGHKITLSQFITAAGDLGPVAVPERVSLTRRIGDNLEATVTLNFAAILQKTEPDIFLKPNDHISVGTSWGATPMAIIRNGFRSTYGFGFLLDRNFGSDVFGAPPRAR